MPAAYPGRHDMLSEAQGCAVLRRAFEARGFTVAENVPFHEGGVRFEIDGWDAERRVGYEYLTREVGDHQELRPEMVMELARRMEAGELFILLVDEADVGSEADLRWAAGAFLDRVASR